MINEFPHHLYGETLADAFTRIGHAPVKWSADGVRTKELRVVLEWSAAERGINSEVWPHGVMLRWTQPIGWMCLDPDPSPYAGFVLRLLPVDRLAEPDVLAALFPRLLAGEIDDLPPSGARWTGGNAAELAELLELTPAEGGLAALHGDGAAG